MLERPAALDAWASTHLQALHWELLRKGRTTRAGNIRRAAAFFSSLHANSRCWRIEKYRVGGAYTLEYCKWSDDKDSLLSLNVCVCAQNFCCRRAEPRKRAREKHYLSCVLRRAKNSGQLRAKYPNEPIIWNKRRLPPRSSKYRAHVSADFPRWESVFSFFCCCCSESTDQPARPKLARQLHLSFNWVWNVLLLQILHLQHRGRAERE